MKEHKTIKNEFTWIPLHERKSKFGGGPKPYRKPEKRRPVLWLAVNINKTDRGREIYLVNNSEESLDFVIADSGGFVTDDDDVLTVSNTEKYKYEDVKPNEAVKVEVYDDMYDLDSVLQIYLRVQSAQLGCVEIKGPPEKGGVGEAVLLWDSGEAGKYVAIKKCEEA